MPRPLKFPKHYTARFDDQTGAKLEERARRAGKQVAVIIREIIEKALNEEHEK